MTTGSPGTCNITVLSYASLIHARGTTMIAAALTRHSPPLRTSFFFFMPALPEPPGPRLRGGSWPIIWFNVDAAREARHGTLVPYCSCVSKLHERQASAACPLTCRYALILHAQLEVMVRVKTGI